ncbi:MAG: M20 family metallopeptidase [Alphaproteobacteria bacterium]
MDETALADALTGTLSELIAIPSPYPPGDTREICAFAARRLGEAGYAVETLGRSEGVDNVVARLGDPRPSLVFNAHVDTVGVGDRRNWHTEPFEATVLDGKVHGLGAGNCKGSMAAQLWLAEEIARRGGPREGEIVFTFVGDEERLGHEGLYYLREVGAVRPDMLVLGAQTENQLITEERGVLWVRLTATGRSAHAGQPAAGDNAIMRMTRLLAGLDATLGPRLAERTAGDKRSTMNVGLIRGGHNTNVVPDSCFVEIDRRLLPDEHYEEAFAEMRDIIDAAGEPAGTLRFEFLTGTNGFSAPADGPCVSAMAAAIEARTGAPARFLDAVGVSDGRYFADDGIEIVNFGPGAGTEGHAANESVPITQLVDAALIQLDAVKRLLGLAA